MRMILQNLISNVENDLERIVKTIYRVEHTLFDHLKDTKMYYRDGTIRFHYSISRQKVGNMLMEFKSAPIADVVDFEAILEVSLMRHNPTQLELAVTYGLIPIFLDSYNLLEFEDCLHMENDEHHKMILEVMKKNLKKIPIEFIAEEVKKKIV